MELTGGHRMFRGVLGAKVSMRRRADRSARITKRTCILRCVRWKRGQRGHLRLRGVGVQDMNTVCTDKAAGHRLAGQVGEVALGRPGLRDWRL